MKELSLLQPRPVPATTRVAVLNVAKDLEIPLLDLGQSSAYVCPQRVGDWWMEPLPKGANLPDSARAGLDALLSTGIRPRATLLFHEIPTEGADTQQPLALGLAPIRDQVARIVREARSLPAEPRSFTPCLSREAEATAAGATRPLPCHRHRGRPLARSRSLVRLATRRSQRVTPEQQRPHSAEGKPPLGRIRRETTQWMNSYSA